MSKMKATEIAKIFVDSKLGRDDLLVIVSRAVLEAEKIIRMAPSQTGLRSLGWANDCDKWLLKYASKE